MREVKGLVDLNRCKFCNRLSSSRKVVVGRGNPSACLMIIGEAPGAKEDLLGEPFVGRSGLVLERIMKRSGIDTQHDVYISNVVKFRPPKNRRPTNVEIVSFMPWLAQQIKLVDPLVIVLAGSTAVEALLGIKIGITDLRGNWQRWQGRWVMPMFHPAYLLRYPSEEEGSPLQLTLGDFLEVSKKIVKCDRNLSIPVLDPKRRHQS